MRFLLGAFLLSWLGACSEAEPIGIHLRLAADGSAVVTCRSLNVVETVGPIEGDCEGVQWQERARLFASRGQVADVGALRLGGIVVAKTGSTALRLQVPRGPDAVWHARLAPPAEGGGVAGVVLDPARPGAAVGSTIRIEVVAPGPITAVGHAPAARMVKSDKDGSSALLWVPVDVARAAGETIVFDLTWR
jgi:hypothetical protein